MALIFLAVGWLPVLGALAALLGSYAYARRRASYQPSDLSNERTDRVWHSASLFAVATIVPLALSLMLLGARGALTFPLIVGPIVGAVGLILIIVIDLIVVKPLAAKRTRGWMIAAPFIFVLVFLGAHLLPILAWTGVGATALLAVGPLCILGNAAAAGLFWWAYLPLDETDLRRTFE
jgi:hypothetical protein